MNLQQLFCPIIRNDGQVQESLDDLVGGDEFIVCDQPFSKRGAGIFW